MFFTQEDYRKIEKWLLANSVKDTEFAGASLPLKGNETVAFVQNGKNVNVLLKDLIEQIFLLGVSDFLNVTDKYGESRISLTQAIQLIPYKSRKIGQVITFLDEDGEWKLFQFQGERVNQWNNATLWVDLIERIQGISIIDSEDITTTVDNLNQTSLTFADKNYNTTDYSGLGRVYLRKNIQRVQNPNTGIFYNTNLLTQQMLVKENTIYIVQYDYSLNFQTITVPDNSILLFEGGTISNGTLNGAGANVLSVDNSKVIFGENVIITGTWNIPEIYDSWFAFDATPNKANNQLITNIFSLSNDNVNNIIHFDADRTYYFESAYKGNPAIGSIVRPDYGRLMTDEFAYLRIFTNITSNTHIILNNTLRMIPTNQGAYYVFWIAQKSNIEISGTGAVYGDAHGHLYTDPFVSNSNYYGEFGLIFNILSCTNVVVRDITISDAFGDCLYMGSFKTTLEDVKDPTTDATIDNVKILFGRRNGIVACGKNLSINNCYFEGCGSDEIKGTAPMAAIDFESDDTERNPNSANENVTMSNCRFKGNKYDVSSFMNQVETYEGIATTISDCNFTAPLRLNKTFGMEFSDCHITAISSHDNSIGSWSASKYLIFNSCVFDELNPYLTTSAHAGNKTFISPVSPQDVEFTSIFYANMIPGRAMKLTFPKPLYGEMELKAFITVPGQSPSNTTKYRLGDSANHAILNFDISMRSDSTPDYRTYNITPVFSYIDYSDPNNYAIYFVIGGELINNAPTQGWLGSIFLTSKTKYVVVQNGETTNPSLPAISGGIWSAPALVMQEYINVTDIPSTVKFPSKEMYKVSTTANLPESLNNTQAGNYILLLDGECVPVFWNTFTKKFYTADGKVYRQRYILYSDLEQLRTVLTTEDRGTTFWIRDYQYPVVWSGVDFLNPDGTLTSRVRMY